MLFTKRTMLYFIGLLFYSGIQAQINRNVIPYGFSLSVQQLHALAAHTFDAPQFNITENSKHGSYPRMGNTLKTDIDILRDGEKIITSGATYYLYKMRVNGAKGLVPYFNHFHLGDGSFVHVYSADKAEWIGAFSASNNTPDEMNTLGLFCSDEMIIEYLPGKQATEDRLIMNEVGVAVQYVPKKRRSTPEFGTSGSCEVNVNCPEGDDWKSQKRAVARIMVKTGNEFGWCSGTMINTTADNCVPYLLTADHCGIKSNGSYASNTDFNQWTFYFNYESPDCSNPGSDSMLVDEFLVGSSRVAYSQDQGGDGGSDFLLVKLKQRPDSLYNTYYAGWSAVNVAPDSGIGIHHPSADIKKISKFGTTATSTTWGGTVNDTHWEVAWISTLSGWGITEEGSSGSPIFNKDKRLVGTLTGGNSFCNNPTAPDDYGKFAYHWNDNGSTAQRQLQPWLDSLGTGRLQMDGREKCLVIAPNAINTLGNNEAMIQLYPNPNQGRFLVQSKEQIQRVEVYDITGKLMRLEVAKDNYFITDIEPGVYTVKVSTKTQISYRKVIVSK